MLLTLAASASTIHHLTRVCPKCRRAQTVGLAQRYAEVTCKHCRARIPAVSANARR